MGIRSFNLCYGINFQVRHGQVELPGKLDVLHVITDFLDSHTDETVLVLSKWDVWAFITNDPTAEDETARKAVDDKFTSLACFYRGNTTPRLR